MSLPLVGCCLSNWTIFWVCRDPGSKVLMLLLMPSAWLSINWEIWILPTLWWKKINETRKLISLAELIHLIRCLASSKATLFIHSFTRWSSNGSLFEPDLLQLSPDQPEPLSVYHWAPFKSNLNLCLDFFFDRAQYWAWRKGLTSLSTFGPKLLWAESLFSASQKFRPGPSSLSLGSYHL